jgi:hypothetical protein
LQKKRLRRRWSVAALRRYRVRALRSALSVARWSAEQALTTRQRTHAAVLRARRKPNPGRRFPASAAPREPHNINEERITAALMVLRSPGLPNSQLMLCLDELLASTPDESSWTFARAAGAYEAVVAAMRARAGDAFVQGRACFWLFRFGKTVPSDMQPTAFKPANYFPGAFAHAARAGAIQPVIAAMRRHSRAPFVLLNGCSALVCLTTDAEENKRVVADEGALEAVLCALRVGDLRDGIATPAVVAQFACHALAYLVNGGGNSAGKTMRLAAAAREDVIDAVFSAMRAHPSVAALQGGACTALQIIASENLPPDAAAAAARGVALIVSALATHDDDEAVQGTGIRAMTYIMTGNEEAQQRAADAGAIRWVVTCLHCRGGGGGG